MTESLTQLDLSDVFHGLEDYFDPAALWIVVPVVCAIVIAGMMYFFRRALGFSNRRRWVVNAQPDVIRRDLYRMAEYVGGLPESEAAVRRPYELGLAAMDACKWNEAIELFREAMAAAKGSQLAPLSNLMGLCHYTRGRLDNALRDFEESARLAEQFRDDEGKASALSNIGVVSQHKGDIDNALRHKEQALAKARGSDDQLVEAISLGNIGNIWHDKGELDQALEYHERALKISRSLGDEWGVASALANIGNIHRDMGRLDRALKYDKEALAMAQKIGFRLGVVTLLSNIGIIYRIKGRPGEALKYGGEALALAHRMGYRLGVATDMGNIGLVLEDNGQYEQAVPRLARALAILSDSGVAHGSRQVLTGLVRCEEKLGRERVEGLLRKAVIDDGTVAGLLVRIDRARQETARARK